MQVTLRIRRQGPEKGAQPSWQTYTLDVPRHYTVLDALLHIREFVDGTLGLRTSCRSAICGSCAMRINGQATLACKTKLLEAAREGQTVTVEPLGNMPVIRDLIVDMQPFWHKLRAVQPWLQPAGPPPDSEYRVPEAAMAHLSQVMQCIMCGACLSDCPVLETHLALGRGVEDSFLGPAALAKAYRFLADPRDAADEQRLRALSGRNGIWDCTRCNICLEVCPKGVAPLERILALRRAALATGLEESPAARQTLEFERFVRETSWLRE